MNITSKEAWSKVHESARRAEEASDDSTRMLFEKLRDRWINIARNIELEEMPGIEPG